MMKRGPFLRGRRKLVLSFLVLALAITAWLLMLAWRQARHDADLSRRLPEWSGLKGLEPCPPALPGKSVRLLILGQSNAANFGEPGVASGERVSVMHPNGCTLASDPLPGGRGEGASIWSRLPRALREQDVRRELNIALIAVETTSIDDWSRSSSPLSRHMVQRLAELSAAGWAPDLVLWQQGEADALLGTPRGSYVRDFERLLLALRRQGITAPVLLAHSTHCKQADGAEVRAAIDTLLQSHPDLLTGADTDTLIDKSRVGDCHLSNQGLAQAAQLWAQALKVALR